MRGKVDIIAQVRPQDLEEGRRVIGVAAHNRRLDAGCAHLPDDGAYARHV